MSETCYKLIKKIDLLFRIKEYLFGKVPHELEEFDHDLYVAQSYYIKEIYIKKVNSCILIHNDEYDKCATHSLYGTSTSSYAINHKHRRRNGNFIISQEDASIYIEIDSYRMEYDDFHNRLTYLQKTNRDTMFRDTTYITYLLVILQI